MSNNLQFYKERNRKIYQARKSGKTYNELADEFGISRERCRQIFLKEERRQIMWETYKSNKGFLAAIIQVNGEEKPSTIRTYNCLRRSGIIRELFDDIHAIDKYSDEELMKIRNFGSKCLTVTRKANELYKSWHSHE